MIQLILNIFLTLISTVVQVVSYPINLLISELFPSVSTWIVSVNNVLDTVFNAITWGLGLIPTPIIAVLIFIIAVEIGKHTVFLSTHLLLRIWNVFQKVKFW